MLSNRLLITTFIYLLLHGSAYAEDIVNGIDLDKVKWPLLCPNVGSIQFEQHGMSCDVSHPASKFHNSKVHMIIAKKIPFANNCKHLEEEYKALIAPQAIEGAEWKHCYMVFKSALYDRIRHPDRYIHSANEWISVHFNSQTMEK